MDLRRAILALGDLVLRLGGALDGSAGVATAYQASVAIAARESFISRLRAF